MSPYLLFGSLGLGAGVVAAVILAHFIHPIAAWILAINLTTLLMFRVDKSLAMANSLRVPEKVLLMLEAVGGTLGAAIAMWGLHPRHKTQSSGFLFRFFVIFAIQFLIVLILVFSRGL